MIETAKVYQRVNQILKTGTSGYQSEDEFNSDMYSTLLKILTVCSDNYEKNAKISDMMNKSGLVLSETLTSDAQGIINFPTKHFRSFSMRYVSGGNEYPMTKISTNEVGMHLTSPIRGFNATKNKFGWYLSDGVINVLPKSAVSVKFTYCNTPDIPVLVLTANADDYETIDASTTDIELPENLFNLFVYEMVNRAGMEMKEELSMQYSQMGISQENVI